MKVRSRVALGAILGAAAGITACSGPGREPTAPEDEEIVEIAVLLVTTAFPPELEGGVILQADPCGVCDEAGMPLSSIYVPAIDFGSVALVHAVSGDTLFAGTIVWAGTGARTNPETLMPAATFSRDEAPLPAPLGIEILSGFGDVEEGAEWTYDHRKAWEAIASLSIVRRLAAGVSRTAVYEYTPGLSLNANENRWVFLLYSRHPREAPN